MFTYRIHTIESAPDGSRTTLQELSKSFGAIPNVAGAMAASPVLLDAFLGLFRKVHAGNLSEAEIQVLLLTNAVTNGSAWPVAFHSTLALREGVTAPDVQAIRERRLPSDARFAVLSRVTSVLVEKRGHLDEQDVASFQAAGFSDALMLELLAVIAASAMTNYAANITHPPLEAAFAAQAWARPQRNPAV